MDNLCTRPQNGSPILLKFGLRSSGMLRSVDSFLVTDVSGQLNYEMPCALQYSLVNL
jgi:hypothetical protein